MLSGKSTHGSWEMELSIEVQDKINVSRVEDVIVLKNYSLCDERRNHGHDSSCNGNLSVQVVIVFALEPCDNLIWRASQYFQNMLWSVIRLKDLVSPSHSIL